MSRVEIIEEFCKGCLLCTQACPRGLLRQSERHNSQGYRVAEQADTEGRCNACAFCAMMCPDAAIRVFRSTSQEARHEQ